MRQRTIVVFLSAVLLLWTCSSVSFAEMSSTNFRIVSSVLSGGGGYASSASYRLHSTIGQSSPLGHSSSSSFSLDTGFWYTLLQTIMGDVNGDGEVNLVDAITALQVITGQSPAEVLQSADVNGDGVIGLGEAIMILREQLE